MRQVNWGGNGDVSVYGMGRKQSGKKGGRGDGRRREDVIDGSDNVVQGIRQVMQCPVMQYRVICGNDMRVFGGILEILRTD